MPSMSSVYEIELRPHVGQCTKDGEVVDIEHNQWIVIAARNGRDPRQVGYMTRRPDASLMPLSNTKARMGPTLYGELVKAVEAARDEKFQKEPESE